MSKAINAEDYNDFGDAARAASKARVTLHLRSGAHLFRRPIRRLEYAKWIGHGGGESYIAAHPDYSINKPGPLIDLRNTSWVEMSGFSLVTEKRQFPIGIALSRDDNTREANNCSFSRVRVHGFFETAAFVTAGVELSSWRDGTFHNKKAGGVAFLAIEDKAGRLRIGRGGTSTVNYLSNCTFAATGGNGARCIVVEGYVNGWTFANPFLDTGPANLHSPVGAAHSAIHLLRLNGSCPSRIRFYGVCSETLAAINALRIDGGCNGIVLRDCQLDSLESSVYVAGDADGLVVEGCRLAQWPRYEWGTAGQRALVHVTGDLRGGRIDVATPECRLLREQAPNIGWVPADHSVIVEGAAPSTRILAKQLADVRAPGATILALERYR